MTFTAENILLVGSLLLFISVVAGKTGYKFGVPALLLFLVVGMAFGTDGLGFEFHNAKEAQFIGMVALSVILFSGGMDTQVKEIKPILKPGVMLSTFGVLLTTFFTGIFIWLICGMEWASVHIPLSASLLLAAIMSSTDSASVFAILRSQKMNLKNNLRPMLELESGSNDPMAYMLTIIFIQFSQANGMTALEIMSSFAIQFIVGGISGYILGKLAIRKLNKLNIDNTALYPILLLSFVFFTFSITDFLNGNGYLAVYIAGIMVGNNRVIYSNEIYTFMDGLSWLFQIIMFLCLGLLVNPHELLGVAAIALVIGVFMIVVARPLSVFLCLSPFKKINFKSKLFVSWVGLRGAVPIIFATYPVVAEIEGSDVMFNIVFFITILSLVIQGTTVAKAARLLGLSLPMEDKVENFGVQLPEEIGTDLQEITITKEMVEEVDNLRDMELPEGSLVMIVKREDEFLIPNGTLKLHEGDKLLLISEKKKKE